MNGADALVRTLANNGVTACFANPGTSEMQFVAALDHEPRMRPVLCLFEGVASGAADGYGRIADQPACTLLHLGPGYANAGANLHNARRAGTPVVNIIGDHATYHRIHDAPLNSDIGAWVSANSLWTKSANTADEVGTIAAEAVLASYGPKGGCASLILPADSAWTSTSRIGPVVQPPVRQAPPHREIAAVVDAIRHARKPVVLLGGTAGRQAGLASAARIAAAGVRVLIDTFVARQARGAGQFNPDRMKYFAEDAVSDLGGVDLLVLVETTSPVAFFAYPGRPSVLVPDGCKVVSACTPDADGIATLAALADAMGGDKVAHARAERPAAPSGDLKPAKIGLSMARHMPEGAIVSDDGVTASASILATTQSAAAHDWLMLTGGAIGQGIPVAIGAAVAAPGRRVLSLNGDGAAMYTVQGLWTLACENLDVTVIIFANRAYRILGVELERTGASSASTASRRLLSLADPVIDWVQVAQGLGLRAVSCRTAEHFDTALQAAIHEPGPSLIEAVL
jgi:acetolactate synthase-1/2/3 large subunit